MKKKNIKIQLTPDEKSRLRARKIKISELGDFAADELEIILETSPDRVCVICAHIEFQSIPSIGIKFAEDLIFLGYYSLAELKGKKGSELFDAYELKKGYWVDLCVEDQFRLVVDVADHGVRNKTWWDFTPERKDYRANHGFAANRPSRSWYEVLHPNNSLEQ